MLGKAMSHYQAPGYLFPDFCSIAAPDDSCHEEPISRLHMVTLITVVHLCGCYTALQDLHGLVSMTE